MIERIQGIRLRVHPLVRLGLLFGLLYFALGAVEPTTGLIAQPNQSLLRRWGESPGKIAAFAALLELPWCLKPLYGLLTDFVPLFGLRRKSYLLGGCLVGIAGFAAMRLLPLEPTDQSQLFWWLLVSTMAITFVSVVVDALIIEIGQPRGITGRLQSVQWAASYAATLMTGIVGGHVSQHQQQHMAFGVCGAMLIVMMIVVFCFVREKPVRRHKVVTESPGQSLKQALASPTVRLVGLLLFLWHFNPFCQSVLYVHMTHTLELSDDFYGRTLSLLAIGSIAACVCYGFYCRRVPLRRLTYVAVAAGMASSLAYLPLTDERSAALISVVVGFTYMTASMVLVDLAARACPINSAGTVFASFMAICNLGSLTSTWLGGQLYEAGLAAWGPEKTFQVLLLVSTAFTACCWPLVRQLPEYLMQIDGEAPRPEPVRTFEPSAAPALLEATT